MSEEAKVPEAPAKSPAQLAYEAEEARREAQQKYDPKVHGVGTTPVTGPQSVKDLFKWAVGELEKLHARIDSLMVPPQAPQKQPKELPPVDPGTPVQ